MDATFCFTRRLALLAAAVAAGLALTGAGAQAAAMRAVRVGKPPSLPAGARRTGGLGGNLRVSLTVALRPRDAGALAAYAAAVSDPASPSYHRYLSVAQFARRFGATAPRIAAVERALRAEGLRPGRVTANGLAIDLVTTAARAERAFSTRLERVELRSRRAFVNASAPSLPASIAPDVQAVIGLNDLARAVPQVVGYRPARSRRRSGVPPARPRRAATAHAAGAAPQPCPAASSALASAPTTFTADRLAAAYGFTSLYGAGDQGAGQTVAVYELEPSIPSDIAAYQSCYGTNASVSYVTIDGGPGPLNPANGDGIETALDVEDVIGLAPAARVIVYEGPNASTSSGNGPYDTYSAIISQDRAQVVTTSWGDCEPLIGSSDAAAENTLFEEAAVQGQTIVAAAGDAGSTDCYGASSSQALAVDDPASQPFVTGVGGTSLSLSPRAETVWNDQFGAGGGGISELWPMPAYQTRAPAGLGVINADSSGSTCGVPSGYCREVPDVSADADPATGLLIYYNGDGTPGDAAAWGSVGGTSAAAPTWAALVALVNASPGCGGTPVGFANPALYRSAAAAYGSDFYDVTSGSNGAGAAPYPARPGYDMASGLGAPNATALPATLCASTLRVLSPGAQTSFVGGLTSVQIRTTGVTGGGLSFAARNLPPGLAINPATGVIGGQPTSPGTYTVTVAAGDGEGSAAIATFAWSVVPVTVTLGGVGAQLGHVGDAARLAISATDNNGGPLTFAATGLPPGLSISRSSGLISGRPSRPGRFTVTVTAADGSVSSATAFVWTITGRPSVSHGSLSGAANGRPTLALTLSAGRLEAAIQRLQIVLPRGLALTAAARRGRGIVVQDGDGRRLRFAATAGGGRLALVLAAPASVLRISVSALSVDRRTSAAIARGRVRTLTLRLQATDAAGWQPTLVLRLRPR